MATPSINDRENALPARGIGGRKCYYCCVRAQNGVSRFLGDLADSLEEVRIWVNTIKFWVFPLSDAPSPEGIQAAGIQAAGATLAPLIRIGTPLARVGTIAQGSAIFRPFVSGDFFGELEVSPQPETQAVLRACANAVRTRAQFSCLDCIEKRLWTQQNPQFQKTGKFRTRNP